MTSENAAYTQEYREYREKLEYLFDEQYKSKDDTTRIFQDGKHTLKTIYYTHSWFDVYNYSRHASKTEVFDSDCNRVAEFKNIDGIDLFSVIQHSNGKHYLFFSIDLYGYSIMDLSNYRVYHYVPMESFQESKETFIWTEVHYCKKNNMLAVDGCYWACPSGTQFFDLSNPEELPYQQLFSSYDLEGEVDIDQDITPLRWNDNGTIVLECALDKRSPRIQKTIDIESLIKGR